MAIDLITDEKLKLSVRRFQSELIEMVNTYCDQMQEAVDDPQNDEQRKLKDGQTFNEWMSDFHRWRSF